MFSDAIWSTNGWIDILIYLQLSLQAQQVVTVPGDESWSLMREIDGSERTTGT